MSVAGKSVFFFSALFAMFAITQAEIEITSNRVGMVTPISEERGLEFQAINIADFVPGDQFRVRDAKLRSRQVQLKLQRVVYR